MHTFSETQLECNTRGTCTQHFTEMDVVPVLLF